MYSVTIVLLFIVFAASYDPDADPKAVVVFGRARFTILTPTLVRLQMNTAGKDFDDRPTIQIVNRKLPVPAFTVTNPNSSTIVITTSQLRITHIATYTPTDTCLNPEKNTDQIDGTRVPDYPNGLSAATQDDCCSACNKDKSCTAWVYAPGTGGLNCWLMMDVKGTTGAGDRVFGGSTGASGFTSSNLKIELQVNGQPVVWNPSVTPTMNLGGTVSALDCYSTKEQCYDYYLSIMGPGLLTRDGWYLLDDTKTSRFNAPISAKVTSADDIAWYNGTTTDQADLYFFGDGLNYRDTIRNYGLVGGSATLPPRSAFGVWWSRYYAYSEQQFISEVLQGYAINSLPINHVVLDMDWHTEQNLPGCNTWGGYTFNTNLFPQPQQFVASLHSSSNVLGHPVKMLLNLHPQSGVDHCQGNYDSFAKAMGVDPNSNQTIPCDFGNPAFASNIYNVFLDTQPLTGIDYWWTDYGGCGGPDDRSLFWSNYYFDSHIQAYRQKRPLVLSRYGGLGNHRYPVGFSGDTFQAFLTLDYLVQMTPTAANVLFGYWSHDIGGFHNGNGSPGDGDPKNITGSELYLRWIQFGAVSPILRTHCDHCERRIWEFPHFAWMKQAFVLRNALVPYIYTNARNAYDTGVALVHPMYYDYPNDKESYSYTHQYMFGDSIIAAPITAVSDPSTHTVRKDVWLPSGSWSNWNGTRVWNGPTVVTMDYGIQDIPLYVRSGVVLPLQTMDSLVSPYADPILWTIFPMGSASGSGIVYEDDAESLDYMAAGAFTTTQIGYTIDAGQVTINIKPISGGFSGMPSNRGHIIQIRNFSSKNVKVAANGQTIPPGSSTPGWYFTTTGGLDITEGALLISTGKFDVKSPVTISVSFN